MTVRAFVTGHPVAHSRSPLIHGHWLARHGIDGSYERIDVAPADFPDFLARLRTQGVFAGGNVTIPHKEAAFRLCDEPSDRARRLGAVNTLWVENGRLHGDNTDGEGFLASLDAAVPGWDANTKTALLLGAGGASRAIAHGLIDRGVGRLLIANRTRERAQALAETLGPEAQAVDWQARAEAVGEADLVVNTTALGMKGQPPLALDLTAARPGTIVADIVYVPLETPLLAAARARGLVAVDGLGMLLHQAVPGFERWFGVRPSVTPELRAILLADIEGRP